MTTVLAVGECMLELRPAVPGPVDASHAGDTYNTAAYLGRAGLDVAYLAGVPDDAHGEAMLASWRRNGIADRCAVAVPDSFVGFYVVRTGTGGERSFAYCRDDSAAHRFLRDRFPGEHARCVATADLVLVSGVTLSRMSDHTRDALRPLLAACRERGGRVVFDSNYRPALWPSPAAAGRVVAEVLPQVDIALSSFDDERLLAGDDDPHATLARLRAAGVPEVVVKAGSAGCLVAAEADREAADRGDRGAVAVPAPAVAGVVDTSGAGDAFNAAYLAARLAGRPPVEAATTACAFAAKTLLHAGALAPLTPAVRT